MPKNMMLGATLYKQHGDTDKGKGEKLSAKKKPEQDVHNTPCQSPFQVGLTVREDILLLMPLIVCIYL